MGVLDKFRDKLSSREQYDGFSADFEDEYVEIDAPAEGAARKARVMVRSFIVEEFVDIKPALDSLREGYTVALINIRPLREKDIVELKRAVSKLKKTCQAIDGDIAGFGEDWICVTPSFARVYRQSKVDELMKE